MRIKVQEEKKTTGGKWILAPTDENAIANQIAVIEKDEKLVTSIRLQGQSLRDAAQALIETENAEMPQFTNQSGFGNIPGIFEDESDVLYKFDNQGRFLIDKEADGYPIIEVPPNNIEFESQTFRDKIDCKITDELLADNPLPDSKPVQIKIGARNFRDVTDQAGQKIPDSDYWVHPDSPSPEAENLTDFIYEFSGDSHALFFIFDAVNYIDVETKKGVSTGLKYKFYLDGDVIKEGNYGGNEYVQLFNAGRGKDKVIQTLTAEVYNDLGSISVNRRFRVSEKFTAYRSQKQYFWAWDDLMTRPSTRHGGLFVVDKAKTNSTGRRSGYWAHHRFMLHFECLEYESIPEYYKDTWKIEVDLFASQFGHTTKAKYGKFGFKKDAEGVNYRERKRTYTLRELHETNFYSWSSMLFPPTIELTKLGRTAGGKITPNYNTGPTSIAIANKNDIRKIHIKFRVFENEIRFESTSGTNFDDYREIQK